MIALSLKLFIGIILFLFFGAPVFAATIPYAITPGIPSFPILKGSPFFTTEFKINYQSGRIVLSSMPDGTGRTWVDDSFEIIVTRPDGTTRSFNHLYTNTYCNSGFYLNPSTLLLFLPGENTVKVTLRDICGFFAGASDLYLVNINAPNPSPTPTPIPIPTPTPSPSGPVPFLDLPWDYSSSGKDFKQIIYDPNSWFDHQYPLQNFDCCIQSITDYTGQLKILPYKSHSGYDYGVRHGVIENTPVLAAASGNASFVGEDISGGAGNMIKIDHGNGYQTWYEHLEKVKPGHELIVSTEGESVSVVKGQKIGRVGLTGKTTGYHIHLSVFKDLNGNGNFSDDYPLGLTDPLGWEGDYTDPWEEYIQNGRTGAKSYKLFTNLAPPKTQTITSLGGELISEEAKVTIPSGAVNSNTLFKIDFGPFEKASDVIKSVAPSLFLSAVNNLGIAVTNFNNPLGLLYNYSKVDLTNINEDTLSFYFFNASSGIWEKISSTLDKNIKTISAPTNHFSQFAVMGELLDSAAPLTTAEIDGDLEEVPWYRSDLLVTLHAEDNSGGKGVSYIVYSKDEEIWEKYSNPLTFTDEGDYKLWFLSHDLAGNEEDKKTIGFSIDKTPPVITSSAKVEGEVYQPQTWTSKSVTVSFECTDDFSGVKNEPQPILVESEGENQDVKGICKDNAGNISEVTFSGINIDKTAPVINLTADPNILWPPNGQLVDVKLTGQILEENLKSKTFIVEDEYNLIEPEISDLDQIFKLEAGRKGDDLDGRIYEINITAEDLAGNTAEKEIIVTVPHDKGR